MLDAPPASQTLSRGIRILEILAEARAPMTIEELAGRLGVHRSVAYRLLRTLETHGLVARERGAGFELGVRLAALAAGVARDLQTEALPELTTLADELGMTCFLAVLDQDQCVTLASVEPRHAVAAVAQRPGASHPLTVGAPSRAILAQLVPEDAPAGVDRALRQEVDRVRERGFATSHDEVLPNVHAVAVPLALRGQRPAALAVVHVAIPADPATIAERLQRSAGAIRRSLGG